MRFDFDPHMTRWNQMFDKLVEHQKRYHTVSIPRYMPVLLAWVSYQLSTYKLKRVGKEEKRCLDQNMIDCLLDIGFGFDLSAQWKSNT